MKNLFALIISLIIINTPVYSQSLDICTLPGIRERLIDFSVEDAPIDYARILNGTSLQGQFIPLFIGHHESDFRSSLTFMATTSELNDTISGDALMVFDARICPDPYYLNLGNDQKLTNRLLFGWENRNETKMVLSAEGNLGLGSIAPKAKLQVTNGDIYIENINNGIIMKSPDGNCWRITIENDGSMTPTLLSVCP